MRQNEADAVHAQCDHKLIVRIARITQSGRVEHAHRCSGCETDLEIVRPIKLTEYIADKVLLEDKWKDLSDKLTRERRRHSIVSHVWLLVACLLSVALAYNHDKAHKLEREVCLLSSSNPDTCEK